MHETVLLGHPQEPLRVQAGPGRRSHPPEGVTGPRVRAGVAELCGDQSADPSSFPLLKALSSSLPLGKVPARGLRRVFSFSGLLRLHPARRPRFLCAAFREGLQGPDSALPEGAKRAGLRPRVVEGKPQAQGRVTRLRLNTRTTGPKPPRNVILPAQ